MTMSSVEVPNTYLNDTSITQNDLISETNLELIYDTTNWTKNIYEVVDVNFLNTITVKDEDTGEWNSNIIKDDQININGNTGWYRTVKFTRDEYNDVYWEFIMIVDQKTEKTCVISSWTSDYDENTISRLMNSIRFSL